MQIKENIYLDFSDVLMLPERSSLESRKDVDLNRTFKCKVSGVEWTGFPVIAANLDTVGTFEIAREVSKYNMLTAIHKHYSVKEWIRFAGKADEKLIKDVFISTGTSEEDFEKLDEILSKLKDIDKICLDVANGYTENFLERAKLLRKKYPKKFILAGNVVTDKMTEELALHGISCVKAGIGPGSLCTTRKMTGIGMPQLSCVIETSNAAHGLDAMLCADGGCTNPGDIAKAFAAGADFVMIGGMLTGHDENPGELIEKDGKEYKLSYGMSSKKANDKYAGGVQNYRASEGKEVFIPYKGSIESTLIDITGGVRSTCAYVGAKKIKHLTKRVTFIKVNNQINESLGKS